MFTNPIFDAVTSDKNIEFSTFRTEDVEPTLVYLIEHSKSVMQSIIQEYTNATTINNIVSNVLQPMDDADDSINRLWAYVSHIHSVNSEPEIRAVYEKCSQILTDYSTEVGQNKDLYELLRTIQSSPEWDTFDKATRKTIENSLRGFKFSGIDLPTEQQERFKQLSRKLSELSTAFSQNVLDCQDSFQYTATAEEVEGLPEMFKTGARKLAEQNGTFGYILTLDPSVYNAVLTFSKHRGLRERFYKAKATVASDQGVFDTKWDNTPIIKNLLDLKLEKTKLLGFENLATISLEKKMAKTPEDVIIFLTDIAQRVRTSAQQDLNNIRDYAKRVDGLDEVEVWDTAYYSELSRQELFSFSEEQIREYFPVDTVIEGLFAQVTNMYGVQFERDLTADVWNKDVRYYKVLRNGKQIASFYFDLFSRKGKRGGAWMAECCDRRKKSDGTIQLPVTFLTCNFNNSTDENVPALLSHDDVITLFHEFGHGLHHMLTQIDVPGVSGIGGVQWDAVELPSQFMENWCWVPEVVSKMSRHYITGEPLPADLLNNMIAAKNFQSGLFLTRQIVMSLFDMILHRDYNNTTIVHDVIKQLYETVAVVVPPEYNRFECSFSHIFGGGYSAGYYSYLWAEVLSADAFARFEEEGLYNRDVCKDFENAILANGGSEDAMDLFIRFRGREPSNDAFLRHSGIS